MKKLINRPDAVVEEMVQGLAAAYPGLHRLPGQTVLVRADLPPVSDRPVAVISGGGSGHEPAHAGYVGRAACWMRRGRRRRLYFAQSRSPSWPPSPPPPARCCWSLLIVKNYTGDRLNFGLAAEMMRAEGIPVEMVLVADDVALAQSTDGAGRRGLAGTILVHKVAGAAAEHGASLAEVAAAARATAAVVRTMGVALTPCTVPAAGGPGFTLGDNEIELGLGIHGEPGVRRGPMEPADALVDRLLAAILADLNPGAGTRVVLMVNNLGATPTMELAIVARRAAAVLEERQLILERVYVGTFLSALEMAGVSLTVLPVDADCTGWPGRSDSRAPAAAQRRRPCPQTRKRPLRGLAPMRFNPVAAAAAALVAHAPGSPTRSGAEAGIPGRRRMHRSRRALRLNCPGPWSATATCTPGHDQVGPCAVQEALPSCTLDDLCRCSRALGAHLWVPRSGGNVGTALCCFPFPPALVLGAVAQADRSRKRGLRRSRPAAQRSAN